MRKIAVLVAVLMLTGCEARLEKKRADAIAWRAHQAAWDSCIEKGGVPVVNHWLGYPALSKCEGLCDE